jgi:hypothetical protein
MKMQLKDFALSFSWWTFVFLTIVAIANIVWVRLSEPKLGYTLRCGRAPLRLFLQTNALAANPVLQQIPCYSAPLITGTSRRESCPGPESMAIVSVL